LPSTWTRAWRSKCREIEAILQDEERESSRR
jgi:hypothetical protein